MKNNLIFGLLLVVFNTLLSQEFSIKASQTELYEDQVFELEMIMFRKDPSHNDAHSGILISTTRFKL